MKSKIAVFFDRDGTLNVEAGYIRVLENLVLAEGAAEAVKKVNNRNMYSILTTNQTGPARGYYSEQHVLDLNSRLENLLLEQGAKLDAKYYCPHYKDGIVPEYSFDCNCRKPKTGMIDQALKDFPEIDIHNSYYIGDKATDIELANNCQCKGVLLKTGFGQQVLDGTYQELNCKPHFIAENITEAIDWVLEDSKKAAAVN